MTRNACFRYLKPVLACLFALTICRGATAEGQQSQRKEKSSLSQYGITWKFAQPHQVGHFANGEWWVVGPVKVTSITPATKVVNGDENVNGSMVNPSENNKQGLESRGRPGGSYVDSLNVAKQLPLALKPGSSLLSVASVEHRKGGDPILTTAAVLSVLEKVPPKGTLRPPYFGDKKPLYNVDQFNYEAFRNLEPTPSAPKLSSLTGKSMKRVRIDMKGRGGAQGNTELTYRPVSNYGRELARVHNRAALALNLDAPKAQKKAVMIELVQRGIDIYGGIEAGYSWDADGGHRNGRKIAMYIAGKALDADEVLKDVNTETFKDEAYGGKTVADYARFQEGQQHFYVTKLDVKATQREADEGDDNVYTKDMIGNPDWAGRARTIARKKGRHSPDPDWGDGYRRMNSSRNTAVVLIVTLMGDRQMWSNEAMFDYIIQRYWPQFAEKKGPGGTNHVSAFVYEMWKAYFDENASKEADK